MEEQSVGGSRGPNNVAAVKCCVSLCYQLIERVLTTPQLIIRPGKATKGPPPTSLFIYVVSDSPFSSGIRSQSGKLLFDFLSRGKKCLEMFFFNKSHYLGKYYIKKREEARNN